MFRCRSSFSSFAKGVAALFVLSLMGAENPFWTPEAQFKINVKNSADYAFKCADDNRSRWTLHEALSEFDGPPWTRADYRTYRILCIQATKIAYHNLQLTPETIKRMQIDYCNSNRAVIVAAITEDLKHRQ